jgi:hypothetical protein
VQKKDAIANEMKIVGFGVSDFYFEWTKRVECVIIGLGMFMRII